MFRIRMQRWKRLPISFKRYCFHTYPIECSNKRAPIQQTIRIQFWANLEIFSFSYLKFCFTLWFSHSLWFCCSDSIFRFYSYCFFSPHAFVHFWLLSLFIHALTLHRRNIYVIIFELLNIFHKRIVHVVSCWISIWSKWKQKKEHAHVGESFWMSSTLWRFIAKERVCNNSK